MSKYFALYFFLFLQFSNSQFTNLPSFDEKKMRFGYYIGFNQYDFKINYNLNPEYSIKINRGTGINVGLIGELKINDNIRLSVEPGLYSNNKELIFNERSQFTNYNDTIWKVKSNNIHLPILIKYSSKRVGNIKPYLKGGISTSLNLGNVDNNLESYGLVNNHFNKTNFYYELSFGIDFYLRYFKFSPSVRGVFSLRNEKKKNIPDNPWTGYVDKFFTRAIFVNFSFY